MKGTYLQGLRQTWLFSACSNQELRAISSLCTPLDVDAGRVLIREGDPARECFIVLNGHAVAERQQAILGSFGASALVGGLALIDGSTHTVTVTAATPMHLLVLDRRAFASLASGCTGWSVQHRIEVVTAEQRRLRDGTANMPVLQAQSGDKTAPATTHSPSPVKLEELLAHA